MRPPLSEFLPDQRHFLYTVNGPTEENNGIYAGSLQGDPAVRILPDVSSAAYVPSGVSRAIRLGDRLSSVPPRDHVDGRAPRSQAHPPDRWRSISRWREHVGISANVAYAAFSASTNGVLAHNSGGLQEWELVWVDRAGKRLGSVGKSGPINYAALSPDEKTLAYVINDGNDHSDVWLYDLNRESATRFTLGTGRVTSPIWSPDSSRIAYAAAPTTFGKGDIFQKPAAGGTEELLQSPVDARLSNWCSPVGRPTERQSYTVLKSASAKPGPIFFCCPWTGITNPRFICRLRLLNSKPNFLRMDDGCPTPRMSRAGKR